jgi:hypothetical protein
MEKLAPFENLPEEILAEAVVYFRGIIDGSDTSQDMAVRDYLGLGPCDEEDDDGNKVSGRYAELSSDSDFIAWLDDWCRERIDDAFWNYRHLFKEDHIVAYRMITAPQDWRATERHPGIYWTWDRDAAQAHWGNYKEGNVEWLIEAELPVASIDWGATLAMNASWDYAEEREIRIHADAPLKLLQARSGTFDALAEPDAEDDFTRKFC